MVKYIKRIIFSIIILLNASSVSFAVNEEEAKLFIERVGQEAINILKIPIDNILEREVLFKEMFDNNFDKKLIHRAIIGKKAARGASKEELKRFGKAFDKHIVKVYASQLGVYSNQLFIIDGAKNINKKDTIVLSHIEHESAPPLRIDWRLRNRGKGIKIIDISIEGVSLLATKRADFGASIKNGGLKELIIDLETKNAQNQ